MLCDDTVRHKADYESLWNKVPAPFKNTSNNTFIIDLREVTLKGAGLSSKTSTHIDSNGLSLGQFMDDRNKTHAHNVYVKDRGHKHEIALTNGYFQANYNYAVPFPAGKTYSTETGYSDIVVSSKPDFSKLDNKTSETGFVTTEVKSVGVNYIVKY